MKKLPVFITRRFIVVLQEESVSSFLSQLNPIHILTPSFFKICFGVYLLPFMATSPKSFFFLQIFRGKFLEFPNFFSS